MSNPATTADVVARWRPLTATETTNAQTFLDDAYRKLKRRFTKDGADLDALVLANADDFAAAVVSVLCAAVLRVMKNPDGKRSESIDDYTWQLDQAVSAGVLYFTDDELEELAPTTAGSQGGAFSVDPLFDYAARMAAT